MSLVQLFHHLTFGFSPGLPLQKLEDRHRFHEAVDEARRNAVDAGSMDEVTEGRENFFRPNISSTA